MEKIKLLSDSTCDLSAELINELELEIIPLYVSFEDDSVQYKDGVDIHQQDIVDHVSKTGKLPQTGAVGPAIFTEYFDKYIDLGYSVIYTGIGSQLSSCYQSAVLAKSACKNPDLVTLIDSNNLSSSCGLILLKIRDYIKEGMSREDIKTKVDTEIVPYIHTSFCIDSTDYMVKGGRCSAAKGLITRLLSIKPILVVKNGKLELGKKPIGTLNIAIKTIYQDLLKEIKDCDMDYIMVTHFLSDKCANYIVPIIEETCKFKHVYNTPAGSVIGSHCGPGTIGLLYIANKSKEKKKK